MYLFTLSMYNAPSKFAGGVQQKMIMESVMEGIMKVAPYFLVLMIVGTGFMYMHPMAGSPSFYNFCIHPLL